MKRESERFGFFAPQAPEKRDAPAIDSPLLLGDFTKTDGEQADQPADPVGAFIAKAQDDAELAKNSSVSDGHLTGLLFAPSDVRAPVTLRKDASPAASDWSWTTPVSTGLALEKRVNGTAKERFQRQLQEFLVGHPEELAEKIQEAHEIARAIAAELATA